MAVRCVADGEGRTWFCLPINPEPWAIGPVSVGRRNGGLFPIVGQNAGLAAYQAAVREEMGDGYELLTGPQKVRFYFWRNQVAYKSAGKRMVQKHVADVTNLQKGLEDALQGVLFENDRDTHDIRSVLVEQGPDIVGKVLFSIEPILHGVGMDLPSECIQLVRDVTEEIRNPTLSNNDWPPK